MTQQNNQNQNPAVAIAMWLQDRFDTEGTDADETKSFYAAKEAFGGLQGFTKEIFGEIFRRTLEEFQKPLSMAAYRLAKQEQDLRTRAIDELYQIDPEGPRETRAFIGMAQKIRDERGHVKALEEALKFLSDDLLASVLACWPELLATKAGNAFSAAINASMPEADNA